jgi:hypothetical protein
MFSPIKIGYSCWGFLGQGIINTPDGGRSHRFVLLNELMRQNAQIIMLQSNRDLKETNEQIIIPGLTFDESYPEIDALFCEYRWPIPGRNVMVDIHSDQYTPDFARQQALLDHYLQQGIPVCIWDKDQKLRHAEQASFPKEQVTVFEPAFQPQPGRGSLLFPCNETPTQTAIQSLSHYRKAPHTTKLIYIGNRYERDESFVEFYDTPSRTLVPPAQVYGKWEGSDEHFQHAQFHARVGFQEIPALYHRALATVLIAPDRYYQSGHYTQRLFEAVWGHCIPLVPAQYAYAEQIVPKALIVHDAAEVVAKMAWLSSTPDREIALLLQRVLRNLELFSAQKQGATIMRTIQART